MSVLKLASFLVMIAVASGCVRPGSDLRLAQLTTLEASIRHVDFTVNGNVIYVGFSRTETARGTARATTNPPSDFSEYLTFTKDASGTLSVIHSQTKTALKVTEVSCTDAACSAIRFTLSRGDSDVSADKVKLIATRLSNLACDLSIREVGGARLNSPATLKNATLTTVLEMTSEGLKSNGHYALYGSGNEVSDLTGYRTRTYIRNFLGQPSEFWVDRIESAEQSDGRVVHVGTTARTFLNGERMTAVGKDIAFFASNDNGETATLACVAEVDVNAQLPKPKSN